MNEWHNKANEVRRLDSDGKTSEIYLITPLPASLASSNPYATWGKPSTLQDHVDRHGMDFGTDDIKTYVDLAHQFYLDRYKYQVKIDEYGIIRVYDAETNTFGSYNPDGTTRTFFKPIDGQAYFDTQDGIIQLGGGGRSSGGGNGRR